MSAMSVVNYNAPPHKLGLLQQTASVINSNNNNNSDRREIIIVRKQHPILPQPKGFVKDNSIIVTNTPKKRRNSKDGTKSTTQPLAVARRNARERNRVKQVNNGFANLRQHIPNSIAAAFESSGGRGNNKKLSKVETLRMAVEYIRTLEDMLAMDDASETSENVSTLSLSASSFPSPSPSSPALTTTTSVSYNYPVMSPSAEDDDLSTNPTPPPSQHFLRIDNLIAGQHIYANGNSLQHIDVANNLLGDGSLIDADLEFGVQDLSLLHGINTSDSLSPGIYSESSLSPDYVDDDTSNCFISVFNQRNLKDEEVLSPLHRKDDGVNGEDVPLLSLKTEPGSGENEGDNMVDVIDWWEHQKSQTSR